jgi:glycosyltransferase involved in cell wall biosynthesis
VNKISYSVLIPVYNSTDSLPELVERLDAVFKNIVQETHEVILVDDASPNPETWPIILGLAQKYDNVVAIQLMRNFGKTGAVICGFEHAQGNHIFTLDDDLQHFPEDIPKFLEKKEHDVVMGVFTQRHHPWSKRVTSRIKSWFDHKLIGKPAHIQMGPFKLYKSAVVKSMLKIRTPYPFIPALLFYTTKDVVTVNVRHGKRKYGQSDYSFNKRLRTFSNLLINNSTFLLRIVAGIGVCTSIASGIVGAFFIIKGLLLGTPIIDRLLFTSIVFTNGLLLLSIGVGSEYLIRMMGSIESRPPYIIRSIHKKHGQK